MKIYYNKELKEYARKLRNNPTNAEKQFWAIIKGTNIKYDFHRQKPISNFIYDFFCFDLKLIVEIDGASHFDNEVILNDKLKDEYAKSLGFRILRFTDEEVLGNGDMVLNRLMRVINESSGK